MYDQNFEGGREEGDSSERCLKWGGGVGVIKGSFQKHLNPMRPGLFSRSPGLRGGSEARMPKIKVDIN